MSIDNCQKCGEFIDTNNQPEAYRIETPSCQTLVLEFALCEDCKQGLQQMAEAAADAELQMLLVNLVR